MASRKVLYLEDNPLDVMLTQNALYHLGIPLELHVAGNNEDYCAALGREPYDLVISDSSVPGCEGHEALWLAQRIQPDIPFIYFSGHADALSAEAGLEAGALDCIDKQDLWRLKHTVRKLLDRPTQPVAADRLYLNARRQARLVQAVQELSMARELADVTRVVRTAARELVLADGATFVLREGEDCHYIDEDALSPLWKGKRFPMSACISGWSMLNRAQAAIPDIYVDDRIPHDAYRPTFVKSLVMTPVRSEDPVAAIGTYWAQPYLPDEDELQLLQTLANSAALALENVRTYGELEHRVSERTRNLLALNQELEAFSYSISHDLRAPLRAINGFGSTLLEEYMAKLPNEGRHYLLRICAEAARMNEQIDDLLKLFQLSNLPLRPIPLDLGTMASQILTRLRNREPQRKVEVFIAPALQVRGDHGLLLALLDNLLSNAWKYSSKRAVATIEIGMQPAGDGGEVFFVRDNGAGFKPELAGKLFNPFQRLHAQQDFPGTGIGLALSQRIVHRHGGQIWAESAPEQGATFYFTLGDSDR